MCGHDHHAPDKHQPEEVIVAVRRLKEKDPKDLETVEDMEHVVNMCVHEKKDIAPDHSEAAEKIQWVE